MATLTMKEIREMFMERLNRKTIDENAKLKDLGLDSLDVVEMCLSLEESTGIQFETSELNGIETVHDLFSTIEKKLNEEAK